MFFSLNELELRKIHFAVDLPLGEIDFDPKFRQTGPLHTEGMAELVSEAAGEIRVQGRVAAAFDGDCDRCLEEVLIPVQPEFNLSYFPLPAQLAGNEVEIGEDETDIAFYTGTGLDLADILREHILLSLPMQIVCREDCKGICPLCGQNRNLAECGCRAKLADDRWSVLKDVAPGR